MTCHCDARGTGKRAAARRVVGDITDPNKLAKVGEDTATGAAFGGAIGGALAGGTLGLSAPVGAYVGTIAGAAYGVVDQYGGDVENFVSGIFGSSDDPHHPKGGSSFAVTDLQGGQALYGAMYHQPADGLYWAPWQDGDQPPSNGLQPFSFRMQVLTPGYRPVAPWGIGQEPIPQPTAAPVHHALLNPRKVAQMTAAQAAAAAQAQEQARIHKGAAGAFAKRAVTTVSSSVPTSMAVRGVAPPSSAPMSTGKKVAIAAGGVSLVGLAAFALVRALG